MIAHASNLFPGSGDRRIRRLDIRTTDGSLSFAAQSAIEEALRLTTLPGENEGRIYFFRRLRLPQLHLSDLRRRDWIRLCGEHLKALTSAAVHASAPVAAEANSIFFRDAHEPYRMLFSRIAANSDANAWFWLAATGVSNEVPRQARAEILIQVWRLYPQGWVAVAREMVSIISECGLERVLNLICPRSAQLWLNQLGPPPPNPGRLESSRPELPFASQVALQRAVRQLGSNDPRVTWTAMLLLLEAAPSISQDGILMKLALNAVQGLTAQAMRPNRLRNRTDTRSPVPTAPKPESSNEETCAVEVSDRSARAWTDDIRQQNALACSAATKYAGLYFLLTPLRYLSIATAVELHRELAATHFVHRLLLRMAQAAGVPKQDSVLEPLAILRCDAEDPLCFPEGMPAGHNLKTRRDLTERIWTYAVRRWCRARGKLFLRDVILRPGRISWSPHSIDVTLPMSQVDIRIRSCGLDLDPGWLPWFGRVVRFHYEYGDGESNP